MNQNFTIAVAELQSLGKEAAHQMIVDAFRVGDIDANKAFALASECGVELSIQ